MQRSYSLPEQICCLLDDGLRTLFDIPRTTGRPYPAQNQVEPELNAAEIRHAAGCMRVNHAGEVAAQGLYHGQGLVSRATEVRTKMAEAAVEEGDHLAWCSRRLSELHSHRSYLTPLWYTGAFAIGLTAGMIGDKWSLGFLAETERQVVNHLENHLASLPPADTKSRAVVHQMQQDEGAHRDAAVAAGAAELPAVIKGVMRLTSRLMVGVAYYF